MKKFFCIIASLILLTFAACTPTEGDKEKDKDKDKEKTEITLWTYPVGGWGKENRIASFVTAFHNAHPDILVNVSTVDYTTGDAAVEEAIAAGKAPDLILEGPERLSANWGARDLMADLGDLWEEEEASAINPSVEKACRSGDSGRGAPPPPNRSTAGRRRRSGPRTAQGTEGGRRRSPGLSRRCGALLRLSHVHDDTLHGHQP